MKNKQNRKILAVIGVVLLIAGTALYIKSDINKGNIIIIVPEAGTTIFFDEQYREATTTENDEVVKLRKSPGEHSIILAKDNHFPWKKDFTLNSGETIRLNPFLLPLRGSLSKTDKEASFNPKPTKKSPLISNSGNTALWIEADGSLSTDWIGESKAPEYICTGEECGGRTFVYAHSEGPILNADFYPNRDDLFAVQVGRTIYAVEADRNGTQNIQPMYEGRLDSFTIEETSLYVLIGNDLYELKL